MALDKNYIDTSDFSVLQPAIDCYTNHGTATDKLRMYYYQGNIFRHQGNNESAMTAFVRGLDKGASSSDKLTKARMLLQKAYIHDEFYEFQKSAELSLDAAEDTNSLKQLSKYYEALLTFNLDYVHKKDQAYFA